MEYQENIENQTSKLDLSELQDTIEAIRQEVKKVVVGQDDMIDLLLSAILAQGHVLIEGVPGVAKTLTSRILAKCISADFSRIQFTPDLMPSDVLGTNVYNFKNSEFEFKQGPIFSNMILIDEVNRAPAKTQSALFEVMEEYQITMDGHTYEMEAPFMVMATQNPIEQEGTYQLPEAQMDRFLYKITVSYPEPTAEIQMLSNHDARVMKTGLADITPVLSAAKMIEFQTLCREIHIEPKLIEYIVDIVSSTRQHHDLYLGASPRASIAILQASKAFAAMVGRHFVTPDDIQRAVVPVLRHRVLLTPEKEMEGTPVDQVISSILLTKEVPR